MTKTFATRLFTYLPSTARLAQADNGYTDAKYTKVLSSAVTVPRSTLISTATM